MIKRIRLSILSIVLFGSCSIFTTSKLKQTSLVPNQSSVAVKTDTSKADTTKKVPQPKPYKEVITAKAVTDDGLFKVHKVDEKYYFEIPDSLLERDLLIVNRVAKSAAEGRVNGGMQTSESVVRFTKGTKNKIFLKQISYSIQSTDSSENGLQRAFQNSNLQPIVAAFDVAAYSTDVKGFVIDMTKYLNADNDLLSIGKSGKKFENLGGMDADRSYIKGVKSFPINLEITTVKTYNAAGSSSGFGTYEINASIVLLPKESMQPRYYDRRVGYFYDQVGDFDINPQAYEAPLRVTRWRIQPKPQDVEKYKRGELVEPVKPIVYYIDPATPKKWVPYLIQGVNDWQKAFEKAGFKNAIYALEAPTHDSSWSLLDATHNAIIYMASWEANAMGPHVSDPRSGEILESHVYWFHNVMKLLHDWYMVQAGPNDPRARKMQFDDELMGQLIRFVSSHEVGHTLGLQHNFGASSTVPTEKLRDKKWVEENGFCPSIMDYARFNYVAQPEDSISEKGIFPRIGVYDEFAIEWGYRWFDQFKTREQEETYLNKWVIEKTEADKRLWFGTQRSFGLDSRAQSEDLGDNPVLASTYGINNLKRIVPQLPIWTKQPNQHYDELGGMLDQVKQQFKRYIYHVARNIGGVNYNPKFMEQLPGKQYTPTSKELQQESIRFLGNEILIKEPTWLTNFSSQIKYFSILGGASPQSQFNELKDTLLGSLLSDNMLQKVNWFEKSEADAYTVKKYLEDLQTVIWSNLSERKNINEYERFTEHSYITKLINGLSPRGGTINYREYSLLLRLHAKSVYKIIEKAIPYYKDEVMSTHLTLMQKKLKAALEGGLDKKIIGVETDKNSDDAGELNLGVDIRQTYKEGNSVGACFEKWFKYDKLH